MTAVTHIIYDLDGLLLNTESLYTLANQQLLAPFGKTFTWALKAKMLGRPAIDAVKILIDDLNLPISLEAYLERRENILQTLFPSAQALPGARELSHYFRQKHIPQAIATSSDLFMFSLKTKAHQSWLNDFQVIITGDDPRIRQGKPEPDIFLLAAKELKAEPKHCLVFEDAPTGVQAAKAAGMRVIAVPDAAMDLSLYTDADQILSSLNEFKPDDWV